MLRAIEEKIEKTKTKTSFYFENQKNLSLGGLVGLSHQNETNKQQAENLVDKCKYPLKVIKLTKIEVFWFKVIIKV